MRVPFKKENSGKESAPIEANVQESLNVLGQRTLDQTNDGKLYRKLLGVNYDHLLTNSGIATSTITAEKILTVSGTSLLPATVPVSALATANQFSVYRDTAFTLGPNARGALIANRVLKDAAGGYNTGNGIYTLPAAGDWWFTWSLGFNTMALDGRQMFSALVVNSGEILGDVKWTSGANQYVSSVGSFLYCNGLAGDTVTVRVFNGDTTPRPLAVASGLNFFSGYQLR